MPDRRYLFEPGRQEGEPPTVPDLRQQARGYRQRRSRRRRIRRRLNHQKPIASPSEDSLSLRMIRKLKGRGYVYVDGKWLPPSRQYGNGNYWPPEHSGQRGPRVT